MESVLNGLDINIAIIYIDDIVVPGKTFDEAADNLEKVLTKLEKAKLHVKTKKCHLFQKSIQFLGHIVGADGIWLVESKILELHCWPIPEEHRPSEGFPRAEQAIIAGSYLTFCAASHTPKCSAQEGCQVYLGLGLSKRL